MNRTPDNVMSQFRQLRHYLHPYREDRYTLRKDVAALTHLRAPRLGHRPRERGCVWAIGLVRNEIDIVGMALDHLLKEGVDRILIADNMSTDGTTELLLDRARADRGVHVAYDAEPRYFQAAKMTRLAQLAAWAGADWVVPFDADEFWFSPGRTLADALRRTTATQVRAAVHNAVALSADGVPTAAGRFRVDTVPHYDEKVAFRAHPFARLEMGNHRVGRVGRVEEGLKIVHVPYRGASHMRVKFARGAEALSDAREHQGLGIQWRQGGRLDPRGIDEIWQNVRSGRPDERITWSGLTRPVEAAVLEWPTWTSSSSVPAAQH